MTIAGRASGFGVAAHFDGDQAVLDVKGDVDALSVPVLGAFFDTVIASGYPSVVLDLSDMDSIDASGLAITASAAGTLVASGGRLTIRSSSTEVARVLDLAWLSGRISLERAGASSFRLDLNRFRLLDNDVATAVASGLEARDTNSGYSVAAEIRGRRAPFVQ